MAMDPVVGDPDHLRAHARTHLQGKPERCVSVRVVRLPVDRRSAVRRRSRRRRDRGRSNARTVVLELRALEVTSSAPVGGRDALVELDEDTRDAIENAGTVIDPAAAMAVWEDVLRGEPWDRAPNWIHGDLLRPNVIVHDGRLVAVIDYGYIGVGDPATDLIPAWAVFGPTGRRAFREMLGPDDAAWARGRGIALHQAAMIIPYYLETNPALADLARRTIEQILDDAL